VREVVCISLSEERLFACRDGKLGCSGLTFFQVMLLGTISLEALVYSQAFLQAWLKHTIFKYALFSLA
jgi:hypothetical protein